MDRTSACGADDLGSIPSGCTKTFFYLRVFFYSPCAEINL